MKKANPFSRSARRRCKNILQEHRRDTKAAMEGWKLILCLRAFWNNHVAFWSVGAREGVIGRGKDGREGRERALWEVDSVVECYPSLRRAMVYVAWGSGALPTLWDTVETFCSSIHRRPSQSLARLFVPSLFFRNFFLDRTFYIIKILLSKLWHDADLVSLLF